MIFENNNLSPNFRLKRFLYRGGLNCKFQPNRFLNLQVLTCGFLLYYSRTSFEWLHIRILSRKTNKKYQEYITTFKVCYNVLYLFVCLFTKEYKFLDTLTTHLRLLLEVAQSSPGPLPFPHPTPFMSHLLLGRCWVQPICPINPIHVNLLLFKIVMPGQGKREFERHTSTRSGHFLRFSAVILNKYFGKSCQ